MNDPTKRWLSRSTVLLIALLCVGLAVSDMFLGTHSSGWLVVSLLALTAAIIIFSGKGWLKPIRSKDRH